jgi:sulfoxide reductase heme-binding subunit YedZ
VLGRLSKAINAFLKTRYFYPLVFVGCLLPALDLAWMVYQGQLGVNPVETLLHTTGEDALMMLLASLAITPIRRFTGWNRLQLVRRLIGVWSFVYALSHFSIYVIFDQIGDVAAIWDDVANRPFIFVGMLAFVILLVLALTSTNGMMRLLGRNWQRLHRLAYVALVAGVVHFVWGQKSDISEPLVWAGWATLLLGIRVYFWVIKRRKAALSPVGVDRAGKARARRRGPPPTA